MLYDIDIVIDRLVISKNLNNRLADSIELCLSISKGLVYVYDVEKKNLEVYNKLKDVKNKFNFIFTRNTFKYVENFPKNILNLSKRLNDGGLFIWRDKYFDYMPIKKYMKDIDETMVTSSFLKKNVIKFYLFHLNFEILFSKFYFDESFLIIAKKRNNLKRTNNLNQPKLSSFFNYSNFYILIIFRKILFHSYLSLKKIKRFF